MKDDLEIHRSAPRGRSRMARLNPWRTRNTWAYLFIAPFFVIFGVFGLYPLAHSVYVSMTRWNGRAAPEFIGLANYERLLQSTLFRQSMLNGVYFWILTVPVLILASLAIAVILNSQRVRGFRVFRVMMFAPYVTNMVAAGYTFQLMLHEKRGLINGVMTMLGLPNIPWLESVWGARVSLAMLVVWAWLGYNMVIMLAGLQTIPRELVEAARVDGANHVQAFFHITIPLMRPVILFSLVLSTAGSFGLFAENMALFQHTSGRGPLNATVTPIVAIFHAGFRDFNFGYASAMAYAYFGVIFVASLVQMRYLGRGSEG